MRQRLHIDEVGHANSGASRINENERYLSLTGAAFEKGYIRDLVYPAMDRLRTQYFVTYLMQGVAGDKVEEIDHEITAELQDFPGTNRRLIAARNWLGLTFDEKNNIWAEWYVEGKDIRYTKVIRWRH